MSRKSRFWSDKFNDEMYNSKFWLISGVEHLPTIFTRIGGIHQMPWLCSSCVITSNQVKMSLKPRLCIPESAYTQHMATGGQTSRWKRRKSRQLPRNFQILAIYLDEHTLCPFHPPLCLTTPSWSYLGGCPDLAVTGILSFLRSQSAAPWTQNINMDVLIWMYYFWTRPPRGSGICSRAITGRDGAFWARSHHGSPSTSSSQCQSCHTVGT